MFLRPVSAFLASACLLGLAIATPGCDDDTPVNPGPAPPPPVTSPGDLLLAWTRPIDNNDCDRVATLLANEPATNATFRFMTCTPTDLGETSWGYAEEVLIFCRLLAPMLPLPGVPPVPSELWPETITLSLTPQESFAERPDLYLTDGGADGKLDPQRWRALDALHTTDIFFEHAGTDYKVEGEANFVVIEDLTKHGGEPGRFLLHMWEDLCVPLPSVTSGQRTDLGRDERPG